MYTDIQIMLTKYRQITRTKRRLEAEQGSQTLQTTAMQGLRQQS